MKRISSFIILIFILTIFIGCGKKERDIGTMTIIDSLGWQDGMDYAFSTGSIKLNKGELYIGDHNSIWVYDANTFQYLRSFGEKGKGPGESSSFDKFVIDKSVNVVVADFLNQRIQWFTREGLFKKSLRTGYVSNIYNYDNDISITNFWLIPDYKYQKLENDTLKTILDLDEICDELDIKERSEKELLVLQKEGKIFIGSKYKNPNLFYYDSSSTGNHLTSLESPLDDYNYPLKHLTNLIESENSFFTTSSFITNYPKGIEEGKSTSAEMKELSGMQVFLCEYSYNGKLLKSWLLPHNINAYRIAIAENENLLYVSDFYNGMVYKLELN